MKRCTDKKFKSNEICNGELKPIVDFFKQDGKDRYKQIQKSFKKQFGHLKKFKPIEEPKGYNCIDCGAVYSVDFKREKHNIGWLGKNITPKQRPLFIIDSDVLKLIFENEEKGVKMLNVMAQLKVKGNDYEAVTSISAFLQALWQMDKNKVKVENIQNVVDMIKIGFMSGKEFTHFEYKNNKKVTREIIQIANKMSGGR